MSDYPRIDIPAFWRAMAARAVGTAVVTARDGQERAGFLALSPAHLCAAPPILTVSVSNATSALATVIQARHFAINYLATQHEELAQVFAGKRGLRGDERFQRGNWSTLESGAPTLEDATGVLDCLLEDVVERYGTKLLFGRLIAHRLSGTMPPLVSFGGTYVTTAPIPREASSAK